MRIKIYLLLALLIIGGLTVAIRKSQRAVIGLEVLLNGHLSFEIVSAYEVEHSSKYNVPEHPTSVAGLGAAWLVYSGVEYIGFATFRGDFVPAAMNSYGQYASEMNSIILIKHAIFYWLPIVSWIGAASLAVALFCQIVKRPQIHVETSRGSTP